MDTAFLADAVYGHDVGVVQLGRGRALVLEALELARVQGGGEGQDLDLNSGFRDDTRALARQTIETFSGGRQSDGTYNITVTTAVPVDGDDAGEEI